MTCKIKLWIKFHKLIVSIFAVESSLCWSGSDGLFSRFWKPFQVITQSADKANVTCTAQLSDVKLKGGFAREMGKADVEKHWILSYPQLRIIVMILYSFGEVLLTTFTLQIGSDLKCWLNARAQLCRFSIKSFIGLLKGKFVKNFKTNVHGLWSWSTAIAHPNENGSTWYQGSWQPYTFKINKITWFSTKLSNFSMLCGAAYDNLANFTLVFIKIMNLLLTWSLHFDRIN